MTYLGPVEVPPEPAVPVSVPPPARIPRAGALLFFLGALLVAVSFALLAGEYYQIVFGPYPIGNQFILLDASQSTTLGIGLILIGIGWVLDQAAVERRLSPLSPAFPSGRATVALATFLVGALCAASGQFVYATLEWAAYAQVNVTTWDGLLPTLESVLAVGVLLMALGWIVRHLQSLSSIESRFP